MASQFSQRSDWHAFEQAAPGVVSALAMLGKAIDVRIPGVSAEYLGKLMRWLSRGGVGVYDNRNFVHIDTGRVRTWRG